MNRKKIFITSSISFAGLFALASCNNTGNNTAEVSTAKTYYVAADAEYDRTGTKDDPMHFSDVLLNIAPGDTILMKEGNYKFSSRINIESTMSGSPNYYINIMPENEGDVVTFDFSDMVFRSDNRGIQLYADFWHFKGINICGAGDNGLYIAGSYNIIENCQFYNNRDSGLQLGRALSGDNTVDKWPSYNLIKNCTSFANFDDETYGENADGFAAKLTIGYGNTFDGCIAFRNSDDGWDMYAKQDSGNIGTVYLYNCVAFENGYLPYKYESIDAEGNKVLSYDTLNGDGIGFKLGGSTMEGDVYLENCLAFNNKLHGVGDNSNPGFLNINNVTSVNNCTGVEEDGKISAVRGIVGNTNKSNNFDLARDQNSYNNYYGLLSYTSNQVGFDVTKDDNSYNSDKYRGTAAYSIFNTGYSESEVYRAFKETQDASVYASSTVDSKLALGSFLSDITMNDECFESLESINALCASRDDLASLLSIGTSLRNEDYSVNTGSMCKIVNPDLLTYANGESIGATLCKTSWDQYNHKTFTTFEDCTTSDEVIAKAAYEEVIVLTNQKCVFQDFEIPKTINGCDIVWTSSNTDVLQIANEETNSISATVYGTVHVNVPETKTNVTLTATLKKGDVTLTKTFEITVMHRDQTLGELVSTSEKAIRVPVYGVYCAPTITALDASSQTINELDPSLYDLEPSYRYAADRNSTYYDIDAIYTSVAGVYEVTMQATSKIPGDVGNTSKYVYYVYVVDPDCVIDLVEDEEEGIETTIGLTDTGFVINATLSNIEGYIYAVNKKKADNTMTAEKILADETVQRYEITSDTCNANFEMDNSRARFVYYVVANKNNSYFSKVYSFNTSVVSVTTCDQIHQLAVFGQITGINANSTTIYILENDLDFTNYDWKIGTKTTCDAFSGLLNGNGHKISNLKIEQSAQDPVVNMFYKLKGGTIENLYFENIIIINTHATSAKKVAIVGDMCGGYLYNIDIKNIKVSGTESVGGLVGQVTGMDNHISQVSVTNSDEKDESGNLLYSFHVTKKYVGGIVGNIQKDSTQPYIKVTVRDCITRATVGDGKDSGGCVGGIIGRIKNESEDYFTDVQRCVFYGTIIAYGNYDGGIIGGFESGVGKAVVSYNFSDAVIILNGTLFDARANAENADTTYAHKNANPVVGRYTVFINGLESFYNYGSWEEYSSSMVDSRSFLLASSGLSYFNDDEEYIEWEMTASFIKDLQYDIDNIWIFDANAKTIYLRHNI